MHLCLGHEKGGRPCLCVIARDHSHQEFLEAHGYTPEQGDY